MTDGVRRAAERLSAARRVTVLTGAGVSAASGIPTFRGAGGLWKTFRAEDLATPGAFARDPRTVWEWYDWRRQLVAKARPNAAHETIAAWSRPGRRAGDCSRTRPGGRRARPSTTRGGACGRRVYHARAGGLPGAVR